MAHGRTSGRLPGLMLLFGSRCGYCGCKVYARTHRNRDLDKATVDHKIPRSRGGTDAWSNLVLACLECNEGKGDGPAPAIVVEPGVLA